MSVYFKPTVPRKQNPQKPVANNRVRIIGGEWRSRMIEFPDADELRPTANRVRETLFNWLGQRLHDKRCLDLFAGSGALGFEAASRGAPDVAMVELDAHAMKGLKTNQAILKAHQCHLFPRSANDFLAANREKFDIIFLDPPFASGLMVTILNQLDTHLAPDGVVYAEWRLPLAEVIASIAQPAWQVMKSGKAGAVHFALLSIVKDET